MENNRQPTFNPGIFNAAITAGFLALLPLFIFQFTIEHGQDLATREAIWKLVPARLVLFFYFLEFVMVACTLLSLVLGKWFFFHWWRSLRTKKFSDLLANPQHHPLLQLPMISLMVLFYALGPTLHYFFPLTGKFLIPTINGVVILWALIFSLIFALQLFLWRYGQEIQAPNHLASPYSAFTMALLAYISAEFTTVMPAESIVQLPATLTLIATGTSLFFILPQITLLATSSVYAPGTNIRACLLGPSITFLGVALFRMGHFQVHNYTSNIGNFSYLIAGATYGLVIWSFLLASLFFSRPRPPAIAEHHWVSVWPLISLVLIGCLIHKFLFSNIVFYSFLLFCLLSSILMFAEILWHYRKFTRRQGLKFWQMTAVIDKE